MWYFQNTETLQIRNQKTAQRLLLSLANVSFMMKHLICEKFTKSHPLDTSIDLLCLVCCSQWCCTEYWHTQEGTRGHIRHRLFLSWLLTTWRWLGNWSIIYMKTGAVCYCCPCSSGLLWCPWELLHLLACFAFLALPSSCLDHQMLFFQPKITW